jgi:energy-coupling factor transport system ATP-binding protein
MIIFKDVIFKYEKEKIILNNINLKIIPGEFIAVIGSVGSGKTTLAKHINGLLIPDNGKVIVDGLCTGDKRNILEIRSKIGFVFQNPESSIAASTVEEDIAFGPENLGIAPDEIQERVKNALKDVGMQIYAQRPTYMLSGGQKQRTALAGALAMESKYFVLDEAASMLDPKGKTDLMKLLKKINEKYKKTIIFVTHKMEEAVQAKRLIALKSGEIIFDGETKNFFSQKDYLQKIGFELPIVTQIGFNLEMRGIKINNPVLTEKELVDKICY